MLSLLAAVVPESSSAVTVGATVCRRFSTMFSMSRQLRGTGVQPAASSGLGRSSSVRVLASTSGMAAAGQKVAAAQYSTSRHKPAGPDQVKTMLHVRGIGKSYEKLLRQQGIQTVEQLSGRIIQQLSEAAGDTITSTPAVKYLQGLGIRRQDHAQRIVMHITSIHAPELHQQLQLADQGSNKPEVTFCVEGNISAGKSTFLGYITNNNEHLQQELGVVHEPVDQWQRVPTVEGGTLNLLDRFYQDPQKYAYTFQNYVFMSRVMQERNSAHMQQPVRLMERSVFSDRMVFVRAVRESGWMGDVELAVYDSWFGPILDSNPSLKPDGFIYLKCEPSTCMERLKMRGRHEEETISMEYLEGLHAKHEDWLGTGRLAEWLRNNNSSSRSSHSQQHNSSRSSRRHSNRPYTVTASGLLVPSVPERLQDNLYYLNKDGPGAPRDMHAALHNVPALVLDCNADVLRDRVLQEQVQATVVDYITFMRDFKRLQHQLKQQEEQTGRRGREDVHGGRYGPSPHHTQPGAPQGVQEQSVMMVQSVAEADQNVKVVPNSSGLLGRGDGQVEQMDASILGSSRLSLNGAVNGSLEVLATAKVASRAIA